MKLVVEQSGSGPKLTLVHGWAMHGGLFGGLVEHLEDFLVQRIDLPGHGRNRELAWPAEPAHLHHDILIEALAEAADGGWLVGWSLGGLLAMQAALAYPERLNGLILIAATPCFGQRPHWPHGVAAELIDQLAGELAGNPEQVLQRFLALEVHGSEHAAADLRLLRNEAFRHGLPNRQALQAGLDRLRHTDLSTELEKLQLPVLLIGGRRDRLVPFQALQTTAERLPNARIERIAGAAHAPFLTNPEAVATAIARHLESVP
jgi:pimeloyl-[acyl-carrier protein] methyl ester esterase